MTLIGRTMEVYVGAMIRKSEKTGHVIDLEDAFKVFRN